MALNIKDDNFEAIVAEGKPVLLDFWATWCGPCQMLAPVLEQLDGELEGKVSIKKLNVDENPKTSAAYDVMSIPTMVLFKDGKAVETIIGFMGKEQIKNRILAAL